MTDSPSLKVDPHETPKRRHRSKHGLGVFVTDTELFEYLGVPEKTARPILRALDDDPYSGFPKKDKLWGGRRYLPAVRAYLDKHNGFKVNAPPTRERTYVSGR